MYPKQRLVDVINLNSDASCLSSSRWLNAILGGKESELYNILLCYVENRQKVNLGFVGSTLAEIIELNPDCIDLINRCPQNFEIIYRPFVHSLSILWRDETFKRNYDLGKQLTESTFSNVSNWYLPPEFALRNSQIYLLAKEGVGTFIHPKRMKKKIKDVSIEGYGFISGIHKSELKYLGFTESFDRYYLELLQKYTSDVLFNDGTIIGWRDGESPFLLPDSLQREKYFVKKSSEKFERLFLSELDPDVHFEDVKSVNSYPQNSLLPWMGGFRLYWYVQEVKNIENNLNETSLLKRKLFMFLLNSDILSCTEKSDVQIEISPLKGDSDYVKLLIPRVEKNLDAEEILYLIKNIDEDDLMDTINNQIDDTLKIRLNARIKSLNLLEGIK